MFSEHPLYSSHCLCQLPLTYTTLCCTIISQSPVFRAATCIQGCLTSKSIAVVASLFFLVDYILPSFTISSLKAGLWTRASGLYWGSFSKFCLTASFHVPKAAARGHLSHLPKPNLQCPTSVPLVILYLLPFLSSAAQILLIVYVLVYVLHPLGFLTSFP